MNLSVEFNRNYMRQLVQIYDNPPRVPPYGSCNCELEYTENSYKVRKIKSSKFIGKVVSKIKNDISTSMLNLNKPNRFICDIKRSYLVCGGSDEMWTDVVEWLVQHGARRIIVSVEANPIQNNILRRLHLLRSHFEADIIFVTSEAGTEEGLAHLLSEVRTLGPIHLVFTLPNRTTGFKANDTGPVQFIDSALRKTAPNAVLLNFISSAAGLCHIRVEAGFATYNIQWSKNLNISDAIFILDKILIWRLSDVVAKKIQTEKDDTSIRGPIEDLANVIPTIEEIINEQKNATEEPEWVQVVSEGPREIRGLPPVFIVPGMTGQRELQGMVCKLLFPTFVTVPPVSSWPIDKMAEVYAKKMWAIYPKGVFNMIILSSGGVLAIEIAKILQREKGSVHLFFIDSAPKRIHQALQKLGESRDQQDINLLKIILDIKDSEVMNKLESITDWKSRLDTCLEGYEGTKCQQTLLRAGLLKYKYKIK